MKIEFRRALKENDKDKIEAVKQSMMGRLAEAERLEATQVNSLSRETTESVSVSQIHHPVLSTYKMLSKYLEIEMTSNTSPVSK